MGADSPRNRGNQPAWKTSAGAADARRGPQYKWKPADAAAPGTGGRRLKQLLLLGGTLASLGGIVWLILLLLPTPQACFVAVSVDPAANAEQLDVPLDLYGWQTAHEFLKLGQARADQSTRWVGKPPTPPTDEGNPLRLPETEAGLPDWANRIKGFDPLVIYVGLHGGTDGSGQPFLFNGRSRLPVAALINTLSSDPLKSKQKILILDCGRLPPDPVYGQIHDNFAARIKDLDPAIAADPNLVVLCGASPGQHGWESEELRATSFGHAILRGLRGEIDTQGNNVITARALFESARQKTREWAQNNRPAVQEPFLLPEGEGGLARAAEIDLGPKPAPELTDPAPVPAPLLPSLEQFWADHDTRSAQTPGPAAYAPRAWRRYRELLLRYEQAVRLGDQSTAAKLATALGTARGEIDRAAVGKLESARNSLALWAAVNASGVVSTDADLTGFPPEIDKQIRYAARSLRLFDNTRDKLPERLAKLAALLRKFEPPDRRPAEAHLPVMAEDFYTTVLGQPQTDLPAEWVTAIEVRILAERAAAGLPIPARTGPETVAVYPERVWPVIRQFVLDGDRKRRQAEDALFASDPNAHKQAGELLQAARQDYTNAATVAQAARTAFAVRDTVMADLPFLTRWYAERYSSAKEASDLIDLWDRTHALAAELDDLAVEPTADIERARKIGDSARQIEERYNKFLTEFQAEANRAQTDAALQAEWWAKQQLLNVPLMRFEARQRVRDASRKVSGRLLAGQQSQKIATDALKSDAKNAAEVRGKLALAALGRDLLNAQHDADTVLPKADILDRDLTTIATATDPAQWPGPAAQVGAGLADHFARLGSEMLTPDPNPQAQAERASRSAVPFDAAAGWESAAANHRLRWRAYLTDLAERAAEDHWYDEKQSPYFKVVAQRYLADADRMTAELVAGTQPERKESWNASLPPTLIAKLNVPPLTARNIDALPWTSEPNQTIPFDLGPLPKDYPVTGRAVAVGRFNELAPIQADAESLSRPLLPIPAGPLGLDIKLKLDIAVEEVTRPDCRAACTVYFRGQRPTQTVTINLRRKPDLVIASPPPPASLREPFVAVRAERNLDLGSVVILLDYSDSMNHNLRPGQTKFAAAMKAVGDLLKELPKDTPLRIRVFADEKSRVGNLDASRVVFGAGGEDDQPKVTWGSDQDKRYRSLIDTLAGIPPYGYTPLAQSIIEAVDKDFDDLTGSRTLLVLTDGGEDDGKMRGRTAGEKTAFISEKARRLADRLDDEKVSIHVVRFVLDDATKKESADLFGPLMSNEPEMVRLWDAGNGVELRQVLLDAIRPKLKLTDRFGARPGLFPKTGWPSRPVDSPVPPFTSYKPHWSPRIETSLERPFKVSADPAQQKSQFELNLRDGERMLLSFGKDGDRVRIRRELYADYLPYPQSKIRAGNDHWLMTTPSTVFDSEPIPPELLSRVYLEQIPPHRRKKGGEAAEIETLEFAHPDLTWWQVAPARDKSEKPIPTGTLRVTRTYGYPAPTWDVKAKEWPLSPPRPAEIKVWAADETPGADFVTCFPDKPQSLATEAGDKITLRTTIEPWHAVGFDKPIECLVVRCLFEKGKPVMVRPVELTTYSEHRYYGNGTGADGMIAYTAVFQMPLDKVKGSGARLKLMPVQPCLKNDNLMTLTTPIPRRGKAVDADSLPQPFDPKKK